MQNLMNSVARNLGFTARERTETGQPLVLTALERAYLISHRPVDGLSLPWVDKVSAGWCCVAEKVIKAGDWPALLEHVSEEQGLAFHQSSALWWRIGVYERTSINPGSSTPTKPRTGKDVFKPMDLGIEDTFAERRRACDQTYDTLRGMVRQLEADYGRDHNPSWAVSEDLFICWLEASKALHAYEKAHLG